MNGNFEKTTIAFWTDSPYVGGAEKYLSLLATGLDRERFSPVLIMDWKPGLEPLRRHMEREEIPVCLVSFGTRGVLSGTREFYGLMRNLRPDILHLNLPGPHNAHYSLIAPIARWAGARTVISTEHLAMVPTFFKGRMLKSFGTNWISRVITVCEDNRASLTHIHGVPNRKISVVHNGIPDPGRQSPARIREELGLPGDAFLLLLAASLEERKGHETVFKALDRLPARVHLLVVGEGEKQAPFLDEVARLGITDRVHFLGLRDNVLALMRDADLLVLPSWLDATPYVIIEAMASRLPVIASDIYGIPELVVHGESGYLIGPGDIAALAVCVRRLMEDESLRRKMGVVGRKHYESKFTIEKSIARTVAVYESVTGR